MKQLLLKLTGFDSNPDYFTHTEVIKEANRKFSQTWLIINGSLELVSEFSHDTINVIVDGENKIIYDVDSIEIWMPEPGIYPISKDKYVYLHRIPKRQWLKSFSPYQNYSAIPIGSANEVTVFSSKHIDFMFNNWEHSKSDNWLCLNDYIIYKFHVVGKVLDGMTIQVTDTAFYQEIFEKWHRNFQITLAKWPLGPDQDESSKDLS